MQTPVQRQRRLNIDNQGELEESLSSNSQEEAKPSPQNSDQNSLHEEYVKPDNSKRRRRQHQLDVNARPKSGMSSNRRKQMQHKLGSPAQSLNINDIDSDGRREAISHTRIQHVLKALKEDVVPLSRRHSASSNKWQTMLENMQQHQEVAPFGQYQGDNKHFHHEQVDRNLVGAHIYSNKWTRFIHSKKAFRGHSKAMGSGNTNKNEERIPTDDLESQSGNAQSSKSLLCSCINAIPAFVTGPLVGLLIWPALFSISSWNGESLSVEGSTFWRTTYSLFTTAFILIAAIGFWNKSWTHVAWNSGIWLPSSILVILLLVTHYFSKAYELQKIECKEYFKFVNDGSRKVHLSYSCDKYKILDNGNAISAGDADIGLLVSNSLCCLAAFIVYCCLYGQRAKTLKC